jgi:hypothetical protein
MARKFLYFIAVAIVLVVAVLFALRIWSDRLSELAFVPGGEFVEQKPLEAGAYDKAAMWISRPRIGPTDPARWQPRFADDASAPKASPSPAPALPRFAVFFVHPTSYFEKAHWNATLDDGTANRLARIFVHGLASPFNQASEVWAPRYRQATLGAFLTGDPKASEALDAAYRDVAQAFAVFVSSIGKDEPIVLAGHSQGSLLVLRLLREKIAGTPLEQRVAMVYAIGWPISTAHDLPKLGLPACATAGEAHCIVSWLSFAEPADPGQMLTRYRTTPGFDRQPRGDGPILCTNPLTGSRGGSAPASANLGTLMPSADFTTGELVPGKVPARCRKDGLLIIGNPPKLPAGVLPGNNYHLFDIPLFWENLHEDVGRRMQAWQARH